MSGLPKHMQNALLFRTIPSVSSLIGSLSSRESISSDQEDIDNNAMNNPAFVAEDSGNCTHSTSSNRSNGKRRTAAPSKQPQRIRSNSDIHPVSPQPQQRPSVCSDPYTQSPGPSYKSPDDQNRPRGKSVSLPVTRPSTSGTNRKPSVTIQTPPPDPAGTSRRPTGPEFPNQKCESWLIQVNEENDLNSADDDMPVEDHIQDTNDPVTEAHNSGSEEKKDSSIRDDKPWDPFREGTEDTVLNSCASCYKISTKCLKLLFMLLIAIVTLGCLVTSKMCVLYITSNMNRFVAFKKYDIPAYNSREDGSYSSCGVPVCFDDSYKGRDTVRWIWCLFLCICTPYVFTFGRNILKIMFKRKKKPKGKTMMLVLVTESIHTIGIFLVLFLGLPRLDVVRALFTFCAVGVFPSFLLIFKKQSKTQRFGDVAATAAQIAGIMTWIVYVSMHPIYYSEKGISKNSSVEISGMCQAINGSFHSKVPRLVNKRAASYDSLNEDPFNMDSISSTLYTGTSASYNTYTEVYTYSETYNTDNNYSSSTMETSSEIPHSYDIHLAESLPENIFHLWPLPVGLFMMSIVWWENFVDGTTQLSRLTRILDKHRKNIHKGRTKIYTMVSFWKVLLLFILLLCFHVPDGLPWNVELKTLFNWDSFIQQDPVGNRINHMEYDWIIVFGVQAGVGLLCYWFIKLSVRGLIQVQCITIPILLATPVTLGLLLWACHDCKGFWNIPTDGIQFWNCFSGDSDILSLFRNRFAYVGFVCWIAELWTARHLWFPSAERLAKTDKIFVMPFYCGGLLEQSLAFNRRRNDKEFEKPENKKLPEYRTDVTRSQGNPTGQEPDVIMKRQNDQVPLIYVCATMWHENEAEMIQILKSIFRLDIDQSARHKAQEYFQIEDPDFYEFEAHILFDDAFENHADFDHKFNVNQFVKQFVVVINNAAFSVHKVSLNLQPDKYPTPYGGRLEYKMPGGNRLIVHLKDKMKIRHKKRWSQVMYMFYFLGQRLWAQKAKRSRKQVIADNTFILALDGDVDFKPEAVIHLVDLMKRDKNVAASCGRIHPVGSGPMVWYQKFEYAVAHWLAKCTEHVLGCVLCSPGCFSLFRGSALMDDNVMKTYCRRSTEARHHVQYDQGEDRWLCTLLLQQGYRVEYSAASDAMTYAPEGFDEFFNQRRRWTPSTFANILDLLTSAGRTVRNNENISTLYMIYQGSLMASSILGPATIFLVIVGSLNVALSIAKVWAFLILLVPLVLFILVCLFTKSETQLMVAALLSTLLAVVQMVVLVGILRQIVGDGLCHPNTQLFLFIVGVFFITGLLHPQEIFNLCHGFIYYLSVPSMYLILIIYSLCNLNVVSWGTREVVQTKAAKEQEQQKAEAAALKETKKKGSKGLVDLLQQSTGPSEKIDGAPLKCGSICHCLCCPRPGESEEVKQLENIKKQIMQLQNVVESQPKHKNPDVYIKSDTEDETDTSPLIKGNNEDDPLAERQETESIDTNITIDYEESEPETERDELLNPYWIEDDDLGRGPKRELVSDEITFWQELIQKYLFPLAADKEEQERVAIQLKDLRNKAVFVFLLVDVLLIALIETLNMTIGTSAAISFKWNCTDPISHEKKQVELDPIALTFIIVFGVIMALQFLCMFSHRLMTWLQIVATTTIVPSEQQSMSSGGLDPAQAIALARDMQLLQGADIDNKSECASNIQTEKTTTSSWQEDASKEENDKLVKKLQKKPRVQKTFSMDQAFAKRFLALNAIADEREEHAEISEERLEEGTSSHSPRGRIPDFHPRRPGHHHQHHHNHHRHNNAMSHLLSHREEIFKEEHVRALQSRYEFTDEDVNFHKRYLRDIIEEPEPDYGYEPHTTPSYHQVNVGLGMLHK